ncbi:MAG: hypothetical protein JJV88_02290 [Sulfurovum sp.]|nr:hypothetical protein [Sulfurovaceae bacterium]
MAVVQLDEFEGNRFDENYDYDIDELDELPLFLQPLDNQSDGDKQRIAGQRELFSEGTRNPSYQL